MKTALIFLTTLTLSLSACDQADQQPEPGPSVLPVSPDAGNANTTGGAAAIAITLAHAVHPSTSGPDAGADATLAEVSPVPPGSSPDATVAEATPPRPPPVVVTPPLPPVNCEVVLGKTGGWSDSCYLTHSWCNGTDIDAGLKNLPTIPKTTYGTCQVGCFDNGNYVAENTPCDAGLTCRLIVVGPGDQKHPLCAP